MCFYVFNNVSNNGVTWWGPGVGLHPGAGWHFVISSPLVCFGEQAPPSIAAYVGRIEQDLWERGFCGRSLALPAKADEEEEQSEHGIPLNPGDVSADPDPDPDMPIALLPRIASSGGAASSSGGAALGSCAASSAVAASSGGVAFSGGVALGSGAASSAVAASSGGVAFSGGVDLGSRAGAASSGGVAASNRGGATHQMRRARRGNAAQHERPRKFCKGVTRVLADATSKGAVAPLPRHIADARTDAKLSAAAGSEKRMAEAAWFASADGQEWKKQREAWSAVPVRADQLLEPRTITPGN